MTSKIQVKPFKMTPKTQVKPFKMTPRNRVKPFKMASKIQVKPFKMASKKNIKFLLSKIIPLVAHNLEYQLQNRHNLYIQVFCKNVVQIRQLG